MADGARERVWEEVEAAERHNDGQIIVSVEDARALLAASAPVPDAGGDEWPTDEALRRLPPYGWMPGEPPAAPPVPDSSS